MSDEIEVGPANAVPPGTVVGVEGWAIGNTGEERFAVGRRCRHLRADLADGSIDEDGCLVCPWHQATYDVHTGRMVRGPQGVFAKIPGFDAVERAITRVAPLRRAAVTDREGTLYLGPPS